MRPSKAPARGRHREGRGWHKGGHETSLFRLVLEAGKEEESVARKKQRADWADDVLMVLLTETESCCVVCLDQQVVAARVARCGHLFCGACHRKLLAHQIRSCPVCTADLFDLKPARKLSVDSPPGLDHFSLIAHHKDSLVAIPAALLLSQLVDPFQFPVFGEAGFQFGQFCVAEKQDLAGEELGAIEAHLQSIMDDPLEQEDLHFWLEARDLAALAFDAVSGLPRSLRIPSPSAAFQPNDWHFMYQSTSGQFRYINGFSMKMLMHEAGGDVRNLRQSLVVTKVLEEEHVEHDGRRFKYLNHLPEGVGITMVEGLFESGVLSKDTLRHFSNDLRKRKQAREQRRQAREKQAERYNSQVRQRIVASTRAMGIPAASVLSAEELAQIYDTPEITIVESEVRHKPESKFLSYAAVASPDGMTYGTSPTSSATTGPWSTASPSSSRPSFADKVKSSSSSSPATASSSSSPPDLGISSIGSAANTGRRGKKFVPLQPAWNGGKRY